MLNIFKKSINSTRALHHLKKNCNNKNKDLPT